LRKLFIKNNLYRYHNSFVTKMEKGNIRVIGGKWKGKKISFPLDSNLRPTPDRAKETVFNWLGNDLSGYSCLDLFAGTGAMGIEALSRGASKVDFLEKEKSLAKNLDKTLKNLKGEVNSIIFNKDFRDWFKLNTLNNLYDLIFIDPPFNQNLIKEVFDCLAKTKIHFDETIFYLESESNLDLSFVEKEFEVVKKKTMGRKCYRLLKVKTI